LDNEEAKSQAETRNAIVFGCSCRLHLPLYRIWDEHYLWDLKPLYYYLVRFWIPYHKYHAVFTPQRMFDTFIREGEDWERNYLPLKPVPKKGMILDAGAGEGETILFYAKRGFRNFVAVESDLKAYSHLLRNVERLKMFGLQVVARNKSFDAEDLEGVKFAKIDVEGGERELLAVDSLPCEMIVEIHNSSLFHDFKSKWRDLELLRATPVTWEQGHVNHADTIYLVRLWPAS